MRRIARSFVAGACAAALMLSACTRTLDGALVGPASTATRGGPTTSGAAPTTTPSRTPAAGLVGLLEPIPAGCQAGHLAWDHDVTPTIPQFVTEFYDAADRTREVALLRSEGLRAIAHRVWINDDDQFADVVLLRFATVAGATRRFAGVVDATTEDRTLHRTQLTSRGTPTVFVRTKPNSDGTVSGRTYARVGRIVTEVFVDTDAPFDTAVNLRWVQAQVARLP